VWVTGSYDVDLNLTYWGIGNAGPDYDGDVRAGDNLYTCSVIALDADTGRLRWHYQFSPHDEFDYDAVQIPVLADVPWNGRPRPVMMFANRNGFFYVLDRATGQFLLGKPFVRVNWAEGFDQDGRPRRAPGKVPTRDGTLIYPGNQGGTNWYNPSYNPRTGLFYIPTWVNYSSIYVKRPSAFVEGREFNSGMARATVPQAVRAGPVLYRKEDEGYGAVRAVDPLTGDLKWEYKMTDFTDAGILTTASDLLFTGGREGYFLALNARTGAPVWKFTVGGAVASGPMTYAVAGRQYVAVAAGSSLFSFALRQDPAAARYRRQSTGARRPSQLTRRRS
jgi:alcohol dehydrogenase (cytochrome c)